MSIILRGQCPPKGIMAALGLGDLKIPNYIEKMIVKMTIRAKIASLVFLLSGCGVKGQPLPPLEPPVIGNGMPTESVENQKKQQTDIKKNEKQKR